MGRYGSIESQGVWHLLWGEIGMLKVEAGGQCTWRKLEVRHLSSPDRRR